MLRHPTLATLEALKLTGMATALTEQLEMPDVQRLSFEELADNGTVIVLWVIVARRSPLDLSTSSLS